jgi:undecaprenyl-diphosphatase
MLTYFRAIVIGALQGITELFPISSLGHSVLFAAWIGWDDLVHAQSQGESYYLAFIVALHVATAAALFVYFRNDWYAIIGGLTRSVHARSVVNADARLGLLLIVATIPAGITGLAFEHELRTVFAKPLAAAIFLTINGVVLAIGELMRRHVSPRTTANAKPTRTIASLGYGEALVIGIAQIGALFAGISRSGITMVAGLARGLDHEDAARFSFLLATPIIAAAGLYKIPDLIGPLGNGIRGQVLVGAAVAGISAYLSTRFLIRYFQTRTLWPFALYCCVFGAISIIYFA